MVSAFPDQISGFTVVPVVISPAGEDTVYHTIYMKKHEVRHNRKAAAADDDDDEEDENERTVFAVNLPAITTFEHIKNLCQSIAGVLVEDFKVDIGNTGKIILVDRTSAQRLVAKAKQMHKLEKPVSWTSNTSGSYGLKSKYNPSLIPA